MISRLVAVMEGLGVWVTKWSFRFRDSGRRIVCCRASMSGASEWQRKARLCVAKKLKQSLSTLCSSCSFGCKARRFWKENWGVTSLDARKRFGSLKRKEKNIAYKQKVPNSCATDFVKYFRTLCRGLESEKPVNVSDEQLRDEFAKICTPILRHRVAAMLAVKVVWREKTRMCL